MRATVRVRRRRVPDRWSWVDLRLVPVAAAVWAVSLAAPGAAVWVLVGSALGAGVAAVATARAVHGRQPARLVLAGVLAGVAAAATVGAVHGGERAASPLGALADAGAVVEVVFRVDDLPHVLAGPGGPRVLLAGSVVGVVGRPAVRPAAVLLFGSAEDWSDLEPGQRVQARVAVAPPQDGDLVLAVLSARGPPLELGQPGALRSAAGDLREGLAASARRTLPPGPAGLLPGLVVGDTSAMDPELTADFRLAGLGHLTAVSGANVAIVLTLLMVPLRRRAVDRRLQALVGATGLAGFVLLAGPSPSVVRAAAMGAVTLLALASGRSRAAVPALAGSVCVLLLADPALARNPGFALSVVATAAIVLLAPGWSRRLRRHRWPRPLADAVAVSAAAGVATAPLVAGLSGVVSLVSLPANLLAAPAVAPATVLGLLATLVAPLGPPGEVLADGLTWLAGWPTRWLVLVAERAAAVPDGAAGWPAGVGGAALLAGLVLVVAAVLVRWPRTRPLALAALVGLVVLGWPARQATRGWPVAGTVLVACDVGQGDALVLPTAEGEGVLVDAGPDPRAVDGCLRRLGIERLPLVLLSHLDADHVGGLAGALRGRDVGTIATATLAPTDERVGALQAAVATAGARREVVAAGDRWTTGPVGFEVLAPEADEAVPGAEPNDLSMVLRVTVAGLRLLLTGDLGAEAEARIVTRGVDLTADVLKVPHHGSADADPGFLAATQARVALVSVGPDNSYGHPTARLLDLLADEHVQVHRTDTDGDVAVVGRAGDWGTASRGVDDVQRATALPVPPGGLPGGPGPSAVRATMPRWRPQHPRPRPPGSAWSWARRSCCAPGRSPPCGRRCATSTRTPRSTS